MPTYSDADFEQIAAAIGREVAEVVAERNGFEGAATWIRLGARRHHRPRPSKTINKLGSIRKAALRLLKHLGIEKVEDAFDGPPDEDLLRALLFSEDPDEVAVTLATRRIGRMVEILDAVDAARDLHHRAEVGAREERELRDLTVPPGHSENDVENGWIAYMLTVYRRITGNNPATSVGQVGQPNEGIGSGPLIRFLHTASRPVQAELDGLVETTDYLKVNLNLDGDAWRSRVRSILKTSPGKF